MIIVHNYDYGDYQKNVGTYQLDIAMLSFMYLVHLTQLIKHIKMFS